MATISNQEDLCRRRDCRDTAFWRGLCTQHWARWNDGQDPLELEGDDVSAPERTIFTAPVLPDSVSQKLPEALRPGVFPVLWTRVYAAI